MGGCLDGDQITTSCWRVVNEKILEQLESEYASYVCGVMLYGPAFPVRRAPDQGYLTCSS